MVRRHVEQRRVGRVREVAQCFGPIQGNRIFAEILPQISRGT
jgi:hypothetical protein